MPTFNIAGVPVQFPFEPYDLQKTYMEKVITCIRDGNNGMLESPTGTGKTLSLLCSTLAWILSRKAELMDMYKKQITPGSSQSQDMNMAKKNDWGVPKVIYSSRTHSQLTQAMQELKRTAYGNVHAVVLGSRDQLCIHPDVMREQGNSNKISMCKMLVDRKACSFQLRVDSRKEEMSKQGPSVMDIEDLVKIGQKLKTCPYFASRELVEEADIVFMPYNYLLDSKVRKANKVELRNTIIILDEAHNIEKMCEEAASGQIKSSDIAVAIDDITQIMKAMDSADAQDVGDGPKDFTIQDLALLKEMLLELEKAIDGIVIDNIREGTTFPSSFMFELLAKANFTHSTATHAVVLLNNLIQFLMVSNMASIYRKGLSFEVLVDLLDIVFVCKEDSLGKVFKSFKVHVVVEETKSQKGREAAVKDGWHSKPSSSANTAKSGKVLNYWCFNPGFGMEQILNKNVRSIILTSGTLAPMKPLIAELAMPVAHFLENPHIVTKSQVYVKIVSYGPDREQLISNYANRDNPKYLRSLGQTVCNVSRIIPDGLLVFFPSYTLLNQCVDLWQACGLWAQISREKPIYVEPRGKDDFTNTMQEFYQSVRDGKGACFMAVCRGKVSEGLDFTDRNGRAVIITGLPFPPMKDPKIVLKKRYLEDNRTKENELMSGQSWYGLEATRAVNQAIGRVIRHRHDYGAILLCDARFEHTSQVQQLSKWIRNYLGPAPKGVAFGAVVRELIDFFKQAKMNLPALKERSLDVKVEEMSAESNNIIRSKLFNDKMVPTTSQQERKIKTENSRFSQVEKTNAIKGWTPEDYASAAGKRGGEYKAPSAMDFMSRLNANVSSIDFNSSDCSQGQSPVKSDNISGCSSGLVSIHKRERNFTTENTQRQKRYKLVENPAVSDTSSQQIPEDRVKLLHLLRNTLSTEEFSAFSAAIIAYKRNESFDDFMRVMLEVFGRPELHYLLVGMRRFVKSQHKDDFDKRVANYKDKTHTILKTS